METMDRIAELIVTVQEFTTLLDSETVAVKAADAKTVESLLVRKQFLAQHYRRQVSCLEDHGEDIRKLDAKVKTLLRRHLQQFSEAVAVNALALSVAQKATSQVVDLIVDAMRRSRSAYTETTYGRSYRKSAESHPTSSGVCSVTLNRML